MPRVGTGPFPVRGPRWAFRARWACALACALHLAAGTPAPVAAQPADPRVLVSLAREARAQGDHDTAIAHITSALALFDTDNAGDAGNVAFLFNELGVLYRDVGRIDEAESAGTAAVLAARAAPPAPGVLATYLRNAGLAALDAASYTAARDFLEEALDVGAGQVAADVHLANHLSYITVLLVFGDIAGAQRVLAAARGLTGSGGSAEQLALASTEIDILLLERRYRDARRKLDQAQPLLEEDPTATEGVRRRFALQDARVMIQEGELDRAYSRLEALKGHEASPVMASAIYNMAEIEFTRGRFAEAAVLNEAAEETYRRLDTRQLLSLALVAHRRALILQEVGDFDTAETAFADAISQFERAFGTDHPRVLNTLAERSRLYSRRGNHTAAIRQARSALARLTDSGVGSDYDRLLAIAAMGLALHEAGDPQAAVPFLEEVRARRSRTVFPKIHEPPVLHALADTYIGAGRLDAARGLLDRAHEIHRASGVHSVDGLGETRRLLAELALAEGDRETARALARQNVESGLARLQELSLVPTYSGQFAPLALRNQIAQYLDLLWDGDREARAEDAFRAAQIVHLSENARATNGFARRLPQLDSRTADLFAQRADVEGRLVSYTRAPGTTRASQEFRELLSERDRIEAEIARVAPQLLETLRPSPVALRDIQSLLGESEGLWLQTTFETETYLFFVLHDDVRMARIPLGADALDDLAREIRASSEVDHAFAGGAFAFGAAEDLFEALFGSFGDVLSNIRHATLVPDLSAQQISIASLVRTAPDLPAAYGAGHPTLRFFGLSHALSVVPSPSSFALIRRTRSDPRLGDRFVGFGDPDLEGEGETLDGGTLRRAIDGRTGLADPEVLSAAFEPLPETADELRAMMDNAREGEVFLRGEATETMVKGLDLSGADVLAFATHAVVTGDFDSLSEPALVLTPPDRASPLDDGLLTASEIAALRVDADLVVLSACNTGSGSGRRGAPGLSGLARGFFHAGARSMLVSQWTILSASSVFIVPPFFEMTASESVPPAEALRRAMLRVATNDEVDLLAHPAVWAPFVIVGER